MAYAFIFTQPKSSTSVGQGVENRGRSGENILHKSQKDVLLNLRDSNVEILKKSSSIDISYKERTEDPTKRGGQDVNFDWGYVPDEKELRNNPPSFNLTGDDLLDACRIRDNDYKMIHEKVSIDPTMKETQDKRDKGTDNSDHPNILCVVQTSGHRHAERIPVLRRTWG